MQVFQQVKLVIPAHQNTPSTDEVVQQNDTAIVLGVEIERAKLADAIYDQTGVE